MRHGFAVLAQGLRVIVEAALDGVQQTLMPTPIPTLDKALHDPPADQGRMQRTQVIVQAGLQIRARRTSQVYLPSGTRLTYDFGHG